MTKHKIIYSDSKNMDQVPSESIDLIVTSPPYPMIEMWDDIFGEQNPKIKESLKELNGNNSFNLMHDELDKVWKECFRILKWGGIICINIGDATRTLNKNFQLYTNHARIVNYCINLGFQNLPNIIWRKQTNAPNKFMGSGMLPVGAYVTLEHEYILNFRKGGKREFKKENEKQNRQESAFFWEERNEWFSDIWFDLKGVGQNLNNKDLRQRSAAYPFELAYRLINMFSVKDDVVLDPFLGTGTTTLAAITAERNSIGFEIDKSFDKIIKSSIENINPYANQVIDERLRKHIQFVYNRISNENYSFKNENTVYNFPCISKQEMNLFIKSLLKITTINDENYEINYDNSPQSEFQNLFSENSKGEMLKCINSKPEKKINNTKIYNQTALKGFI